jgi:hypothetical protein
MRLVKPSVIVELKPCAGIGAEQRHPAPDGVFLLCCVPKDQGGFLVREALDALRHLRANIDDDPRRRIRSKLPIVDAPLKDRRAARPT